MLRGLMGKMLFVAASMGLIIFGVTEWLKHEWETAATIYPDGRKVYPDGRVEYPDGTVVDHGTNTSGRW